MEQFTNWEIFSSLKNLELTSTIRTQLQKYYEILIIENKKYNLTTITEINEVFTKHFFDSLLFTNHQILKSEKIADIGSGPGFPGLILKIFFPKIRLTLIESNQKKVNFLKFVIQQLKLSDVEVINQRAEDYSIEQREQFDIVVSRAVAYLDIILEIGVQMLKVGGQFILLKGPKAPEEIIRSKAIIEKLSLTLESEQQLTDIGFGIRINLFYRKQKSTDKKYPRKYSIIKKESGQNES